LLKISPYDLVGESVEMNFTILAIYNNQGDKKLAEKYVCLSTSQAHFQTQKISYHCFTGGVSAYLKMICLYLKEWILAYPSKQKGRNCFSWLISHG